MAGECYNCHDKIFLDFKSRATKLLKKYNALEYEQKEEKEKIKTARETLGRYFYDLSKTSFGTGLLGTFLPYFTKDESAMTEKTIWLFAGCLIATVGFAYVGNKILKR